MTELRMTRLIDAPATRVFAAFADAAALAAWFWPPHFQTVVTADVRPGGRYRLASEGVGMAVSGVYREVEPPTRLVFTWQWDGEAETTLVTIDFSDLGDKTEVSLRHQLFADDASRDDHATGWSDCLDRLPDWIVG